MMNTTNRYFLLMVALMLGCLNISAQSNSDYHFIRSYRSNLSLSIIDDRFTAFTFSDYGRSIQQRVDVSQRYLQCGQEYEPILQLMLFPYRVYSTREARFFQPDPKSQYSSPYSYVNGDPINFVDRDGKEGKPIILYGKNYKYQKGILTGTEDLLDELPEKDAYHVSLVDFVNGEVGDVSEWNGNVFIDSHMATEAGLEIELERGASYDDLMADASNVSYHQLADGQGFASFVDAEDFGRSLRQFSESRGVPVSNVLAGGCEGSVAAERIGLGYSKAGARFHGRSLKTMGVKPERASLIIGPVATADNEYVGFGNTRFYTNPFGQDLHPTTHVYEFEDGMRGEVLADYSGLDENGNYFDYPFTEGKSNLLEMSEGRIPHPLKGEFETFRFEY